MAEEHWHGQRWKAQFHGVLKGGEQFIFGEEPFTTCKSNAQNLSNKNTISTHFLSENNKFNAILKLNPQILDQMEAQRLENGH